MATAQAQTSANVETAKANAQLNRVNQVTPTGTLTYSYDPNQPNNPYTATTALSPAEQHLLDLTQQGQNIYGQTAVNQLGQASSSLSSPMANPYPQAMPGAIAGATGALGTAQGALGQAAGIAGAPVNTDYNQIRQQSIDAAMGRLQPSIDQQQETLNSQLLGQGVTQGSAAWNNAQRQFSNQVNDQRAAIINNAEGLTSQAIQQTGQLRQIPLGELGQVGQMAGNIGNQAGQLGNLSGAGLQQATALRDLPLNESNALLTGSQVAQPQFQNVPGVQQAGTDVAGITQNAFQDQFSNYNAQLQAQSAQQGGMFGLAGTLGGAALLASDRRIKKDIQRVGTTPGGAPVHAFHYKGEHPALPRHVGYIAQELMKHGQGHAVAKTPSGLFAVSYGHVR